MTPVLYSIGPDTLSHIHTQQQAGGILLGVMLSYHAVISYQYIHILDVNTSTTQETTEIVIIDLDSRGLYRIFHRILEFLVDYIIG